MKLTWDETDGWVFTDEYHQWQDEQYQPFGHWRPRGEFFNNAPLAAGVMEIVTDSTDTHPSGAAARWPRPVPGNEV